MTVSTAGRYSVSSPPVRFEPDEVSRKSKIENVVGGKQARPGRLAMKPGYYGCMNDRCQERDCALGPTNPSVRRSGSASSSYPPLPATGRPRRPAGATIGCPSERPRGSQTPPSRCGSCRPLDPGEGARVKRYLDPPAISGASSSRACGTHPTPLRGGRPYVFGPPSLQGRHYPHQTPLTPVSTRLMHPPPGLQTRRSMRRDGEKLGIKVPGRSAARSVGGGG